jgi:hypothetical protein
MRRIGWSTLAALAMGAAIVGLAAVTAGFGYVLRICYDPAAGAAVEYAPAAPAAGDPR